MGIWLNKYVVTNVIELPYHVAMKPIFFWRNETNCYVQQLSNFIVLIDKDIFLVKKVNIHIIKVVLIEKRVTQMSTCGVYKGGAYKKKVGDTNLNLCSL